MISIKINNQAVHSPTDKTVLDVAKKNGIDIPTLCHINRGNSADKPRSVCRMCTVEVKGVKGVKGLVTACSAKIQPGMEILTHSDSVIKARKVLMEFILAENQGANYQADSKVKQLSKKIGVEQARFSLAKIKDKDNDASANATVSTNNRKIDAQKTTSEFFNIDPDLCIHCDRCIVACDSRKVITRTGFGHDVGTAFGDSEQGIEDSDCNYCGDCVSACPAGGISLIEKTK